LHGCLTWEGLRRCRVNSEVLLDDVEDGAIIKIVDVNKIAHLLFLVHTPLALSCHKDTGETVLVIVRPLLPNARARVKNRAMPEPRAPIPPGWVVRTILRIMASPNPWYGTYVFLP
jgi:hypothetical protein